MLHCRTCTSLLSVIILYFLCLNISLLFLIRHTHKQYGATQQSTINLLINGKHNHILLLSWLKKYDDDTDVLFLLYGIHETRSHTDTPKICVIIRKLKQFIFYGEELINIWKTLSGKFNKPPTMFCRSNDSKIQAIEQGEPVFDNNRISIFCMK